jgi:hypothetical protein
VQLLLVVGVMSSCRRRRRCRRHVPPLSSPLSPHPTTTSRASHAKDANSSPLSASSHKHHPHARGRSTTEPARLMTSASACTSTRPFRQGRPCEICTAHSSRSTLQARADSRSCRSDCPRGARYFLSFLLRRPESATSTTSNSPPRFPWNKFGDCSGLPSPAPSALPLVSRRRNAHGKILHSPPALAPTNDTLRPKHVFGQCRAARGGDTPDCLPSWPPTVMVAPCLPSLLQPLLQGTLCASPCRNTPSLS